MSSRLERLRRLMAAEGLDGMLVSRSENILYLSGFSGDAGVLLVTGEQSLLLTDFRFVEQAAEQAVGWEIRRWYDPRVDVPALAQAIGELKPSRLGFESHHLTVDVHIRLSGLLNLVELSPLVWAVERLRAVKEEAEIEALAFAARLTDEGFSHVLRIIRPGVTEREIALELEYYFGREGAEPAFPTIVASGVRSSMPHAVTGDRKLESGDVLIIDCGACYGHYHADMTRTVFVGRAAERQRELYHAVLGAQERALELIRPGMSGREADGIARSYLEERGLAERFGHGLGHGIGLEIHELPRLSAISEETIEVSTAFTVEPGVYVPGFGGVRIEDSVVLRETGPERLTKTTRELLEL